MKTQNLIQDKLSKALNPKFFEVTNESHMHNVPAGAESHFKITMVSNQFEGLSLLKRHQYIYSLLAEEMKNGVHAVALHTLTESEYEKRHGVLPESPMCMGGNKK